MCQILQENIAIKAELQELKVDLSQVRDSMSIYRDENKGLREQAEIDRMKLCACGVIAMANTRESAKRMRTMHKDYKSAACDDVALAVDREMELREQLESIEEHEMKMARNPIEDDCVDHCQEIAVLNKQIADLKAELASDDDLYKYSHCCFDHDYSWKDNKMIAEKEDCPKCLKAELQEAKKFIGGQSYSTGTQEGE